MSRITAAAVSLVLFVFLTVLSSVVAAGPMPVVGGTQVPPGTWPDVVAVIGDEGRCTGTLVAPDVVLTAGHCIELEPTHVVIGATDLARGGERIPIAWSRAFPAWWERYDAGVLMLARPTRVAPRQVAAACDANARLRASQPLHVVGFGATTPAGDDHNTALHEATVPVLDAFCETDASCLPAARPKGELTAGGRGSDTCFGDSGGPAYLDTPSGPALVGIVSRGLAVPGQPCGNGGVYVRADKLVSWIQTVTRRRLLRTTCGAPTDDPPESEVDGTHGDEGGCATTPAPASNLLLVLALVRVLVAARRRRRTACAR